MSADLRDTEQELIFELAVKTDKFMKKLKESAKKNRVQM